MRVTTFLERPSVPREEEANEELLRGHQVSNPADQRD